MITDIPPPSQGPVQLQLEITSVAWTKAQEADALLVASYLHQGV